MPRPADPVAFPAPDASLWSRLRIALRCLMLLKDNPGDEPHAIALNLAMDRERYAARARELRATAEGAALLNARPSLQGADLGLERLRRLPEGSFGKAVADAFDRGGIAPFAAALPLRDDVDFLAARYRQTHDLVHVLTGYETDDYSEMELQAFMWGNQRLWQNLFIVTTGLFLVVPKAGWRVGRYFRDLRRAAARGRASGDLLGVRFEALFELPLSEVRARWIAPDPLRRPSPLKAAA
jgi:ubiquinone biosynthesis protein COQ4